MSCRFRSAMHRWLVWWREGHQARISSREYFEGRTSSYRKIECQVEIIVFEIQKAGTFLFSTCHRPCAHYRMRFEAMDRKWFGHGGKAGKGNAIVSVVRAAGLEAA
jgi:hypothetical protein